MFTNPSASSRFLTTVCLLGTAGISVRAAAQTPLRANDDSGGAIVMMPPRSLDTMELVRDALEVESYTLRMDALLAGPRHLDAAGTAGVFAAGQDLRRSTGISPCDVSSVMAVRPVAQLSAAQENEQIARRCANDAVRTINQRASLQARDGSVENRAQLHQELFQLERFADKADRAFGKPGV